jgi:hypothetical protein
MADQSEPQCSKEERQKAALSAFRVLYGTGASPEEKKAASDLIKAGVASGDICFKCRKNPSTIGAHGVRTSDNGDRTLYDEYWCASCYVRVNKQGSSKEVERLSDD